jgi:hypothetical protein
VLATVLTAPAGSNVEPLIIVGVVVSYITTLVLSRPPASPPAPANRSVAQAESTTSA